MYYGPTIADRNSEIELCATSPGNEAKRLYVVGIVWVGPRMPVEYIAEVDYEHELEDGLCRYLDGPFVHHASTPYRGERKIVANTARGGPHSGKWTRPDLTLVALQRLPIQRRLDLEVFSFELKRAGDSNVDSVFEAVAHTRYAHYAYLAWHLPRNHIVPPTKQADVEANCRAHGIGLIVFTDPEMPSSYTILLAPSRKSPHPVDVEHYLEKRLKPADLLALKTTVHELESSAP